MFIKSKYISLKDKLPHPNSDPSKNAETRTVSESKTGLNGTWNGTTKQTQILSFKLHLEACVCSFYSVSDSSIYPVIHPRLQHISDSNILFQPGVHLNYDLLTNNIRYFAADQYDSCCFPFPSNWQPHSANTASGSLKVWSSVCACRGSAEVVSCELYLLLRQSDKSQPQLAMKQILLENNVSSYSWSSTCYHS